MLCGHNPKDERCNGQFTETMLWRRDCFMLPLYQQDHLKWLVVFLSQSSPKIRQNRTENESVSLPGMILKVQFYVSSKIYPGKKHSL